MLAISSISLRDTAEMGGEYAIQTKVSQGRLVRMTNHQSHKKSLLQWHGSVANMSKLLFHDVDRAPLQTVTLNIMQI